jgi:hypothetical protein
MWYIPIRITSIEIEIRAPRHLVFPRLIDFGASGAEMSSRVLLREDDRLLVEFKTSLPLLFGWRRMFRTVEWVKPKEPEWVEFEEVEGPFTLRRECIILTEWGKSTRLRYEAEFGVKGWVLGWPVGMLLIRPKLQGAVRAHMRELKETIEAEAEEPKAL